jgi:hypothetical protein
MMTCGGRRDFLGTLDIGLGQREVWNVYLNLDTLLFRKISGGNNLEVK